MNIMIVDDEPLVLGSLTKLMMEMGYSVTPCRDGNEAMDNFISNKIDVVITDVKMPEISGIELLENIRNINKEIPVILMTAYTQTDVAIAGIRHGAFDFIVKPYNPEYLVSSIEKAIRYNRLLQMDKDYKHQLETTV